jgi:glutamyl-tRNA synthetase
LSGARRRALRASAPRPPSLRLASAVAEYEIVDLVHGRHVGPVHDIVLQRWDGTPAYHLAVVVDDAAQGVTQVVRGGDLLGSSPTQAYLGALLGLPEVVYGHVPLVVDGAGRRLAKRAASAAGLGSPVTLADMAAAGQRPEAVARALLRSLGSSADTLAAALASFDMRRTPGEPMLWRPAAGR